MTYAVASRLPIETILIVEDEPFVAMMVADIARDLGAEKVLGARSADAALGLARTADITCAILDVFLQGGTAYGIAEILTRRGIPFLYSTGADLTDADPRFRHIPVLPKPYCEPELRAKLAKILLGALPA